MGILGSFKELLKSKKKKEKEETIKIGATVETPAKKREREFDKYLGELIARGIKDKGMDKDAATKWAWQQIERKMDKRRLQGTPIVCAACNRYGCNKETGPYIRKTDGTYQHQNCKG